MVLNGQGKGSEKKMSQVLITEMNKSEPLMKPDGLYYVTFAVQGRVDAL